MVTRDWLLVCFCIFIITLFFCSFSVSRASLHFHHNFIFCSFPVSRASVHWLALALILNSLMQSRRLFTFKDLTLYNIKVKIVKYKIPLCVCVCVCVWLSGISGGAAGTWTPGSESVSTACSCLNTTPLVHPSILISLLQFIYLNITPLVHPSILISLFQLIPLS